jgi:capsular exopolysaccharide synthesis family protein
MSRLEEALRLSVGSASARDTGREVFKSPWTVGQEGGNGETSTAPPSEDHVPGPTPHLLDAPATHFTSNWQPWLASADTMIEQFRRLAATLLHGQREGRLKVLMVTSAVPGEGKTLTALNLALVLAESYRRRVLLIDADLRRPRLTETANLTMAEGLGELLKAPEDRKASLAQITAHLCLLPAGRPDPEPLSGLTSQRMQHLLDEAAERFDWVIVDTPPVTAAADAGLLGSVVDAAVLVVKAGQTPYSTISHAIDTVGRDRIFGVVLNGVDPHSQTEYYGYTPAK